MVRSKDWRLADSISRRVGPHQDAARVAEAMVSVWREIDAALRPVIGRRGLAALLARSLHLNAAAHPCLAGMAEHVEGPIEVIALRSVMALQDVGELTVACNALSQTFHELLQSLIGDSLAEQLLGSIH